MGNKNTKPNDKPASKPTEKGDAAPAAAKETKKSDNPLDNYTMGKQLGAGAFSTVKEATRKDNGVKVAMKIITKNLVDPKEIELLQREIDIMKKLDHEHVIKLYEVIDTKDTLYLALEIAEKGELFDAIVDRGHFSEKEAADLAGQVLEAIQFCHEKGVAHRDLKPENLLLSTDSNGKLSIKIADFGLSKELSSENALVTSCGTPDYVAPEVLSGSPYTVAVDIWSVGVILYVLLCGFPPFFGETQKEIFESILTAKFDYPSPEWDEVSDEAKDLISKILVVDAEKRLTAKEALQHPWMKKFANVEPKKLTKFASQRFQEHAKKIKETNGVTRD